MESAPREGVAPITTELTWLRGAAIEADAESDTLADGMLTSVKEGTASTEVPLDTIEMIWLVGRLMDADAETDALAAGVGTDNMDDGTNVESTLAAIELAWLKGGVIDADSDSDTPADGIVICVAAELSALLRVAEPTLIWLKEGAMPIETEALAKGPVLVAMGLTCVAEGTLTSVDRVVLDTIPVETAVLAETGLSSVIEGTTIPADRRFEAIELACPEAGTIPAETEALASGRLSTDAEREAPTEIGVAVTEGTTSVTGLLRDAEGEMLAEIETVATGETIIVSDCTDVAEPRTIDNSELIRDIEGVATETGRVAADTTTADVDSMLATGETT